MIGIEHRPPASIHEGSNSAPKIFSALYRSIGGAQVEVALGRPRAGVRYCNPPGGRRRRSAECRMRGFAPGRLPAPHRRPYKLHQGGKTASAAASDEYICRHLPSRAGFTKRMAPGRPALPGKARSTSRGRRRGIWAFGAPVPALRSRRSPEHRGWKTDL